MKRKNNEEQSSVVGYTIIKLQYSHNETTPKTHVTYEKNGIKKDIELNGLLDEETVLHVLKKRNF